jgi:hypothetical protein
VTTSLPPLGAIASYMSMVTMLILTDGLVLVWVVISITATNGSRQCYTGNNIIPGAKTAICVLYVFACGGHYELGIPHTLAFIQL